MPFLPQPLHPAVVHFPIVLLLLGAGVALAAAFTRRWHLPIIAAALLGLGALGTLAAGATGEEDEELMTETPASETVLGQHEQWAERTQVAAVIGALLALGAALSARWPVAARWLGILTAIGAFASVWCVAATGHYGGQLVYRHGAGVATAASEPGNRAALAPGEKGARRSRDRDDD